MARVKRGTTIRARHKKVFSKTKGYRHGRKNVFRQAKQAMMKAEAYAYRSRKLKKRDFRKLWIVRINAACKAYGIKYSQLIRYMSVNKIEINRKDLSLMAQEEPKKFEEIAKQVKTA